MSSQNPFLNFDKQVLGDVYTNTEVMDNLLVLCDEFDSRFGGTDNERQAAEFIQKKLLAYGLDNVHLEAFEYPGWIRGEAKLEIISPIQKEIACITLPHSPPANLECEIFDIGDGAPSDFARHKTDIKNKVVLTNSIIKPLGVKRWIHRMEKYDRSVLAGASAFIFVNHYPGYGPATGGIGHDGQAAIPGISICKEDGAFIQRLIKRKGAVTIRLSSTDRYEPKTSWNIIADLPGEHYANKNDDQIVMLGCHYDGHDISQGAEDPASGVVAVMEAARVLSKYADKLPYTIRFALWGVEEIGLFGSFAYVNAHADELSNIRFYLNMDGAGAMTDKDIIINEWPALEAFFKRWREQMALEFGIGQSIHAFSDHYPFFIKGVPTGGMDPIKPVSGRGYGHTKYDTVDKVTLLNLREASALAARLAIRLASETSWPVARRSPEVVQEILNSPEHQEEEALRAEIKAFYKNLTSKS